MRLFRREPTPPPLLLRLSSLEEGVRAEDGREAWEDRPSFSAFSPTEEVGMAAATQHKPRKGFSFGWPGRRQLSSSAKKYAVASDDDRSAIVRPALSHLSLAPPTSPHNNLQSCATQAQCEGVTAMYRSASTSALSDARDEEPPDGAPLASLPEEPDTASLASSTQHRSDESGYESEGRGEGKGEESGSRRSPAAALLAGLLMHRRSRTSTSQPDKTTPTKNNHFKAWTLDRKLLRSRWKKEDRLSEGSNVIPSTENLRESRSLFASALFPQEEDSPSRCKLESKSLPSLCEPPPPQHTQHQSCDGVGLQHQVRMRRLGVRSVDARRRQWLQQQLSTPPTDDDVFHTPPSPLSCESSSEDSRRLPSQTPSHELVSVSLFKDSCGELGVYIAGLTDPQTHVLGYLIADLEQGGPAERSGRLSRGDELLSVNGRQLQGASLDEARHLLRGTESHIHLLLARELREDRIQKDVLPSLSERCDTEVATSHESRPRLRHWTSDACDTRLTHNDDERMASTLPRRPKSKPHLTLLTVAFAKGSGRKSLGFSLVGGRDSPRGPIGFYVKSIFAGGQAAETRLLQEGDEVYTLNGESLQGLSHSEAIAAFKRIKQGPVVLHIGRRTAKKSASFSESSGKLDNSNSKSCSTLDNI